MSEASEAKAVCRCCYRPLDPKNFEAIADGCPCNSERGINHGLVPKDTCTCNECDPGQSGATRKPRTPRETWSQEPWTVYEVGMDGDGEEAYARGFQDAHGKGVNKGEDVERFTKLDAARIVQCVNACAGIPDPDAHLARCARMEEALKQFEQCDLNDSNCASLAVATKRIRAIARAALSSAPSREHVTMGG